MCEIHGIVKQTVAHLIRERNR